MRCHWIALMCAERDPLECHRTLLVARALDEQGVRVSHILSDGRLEVHHDAMDRLIDRTGLPRNDRFRSRDELIAEAVARQEEKVAYAMRLSRPRRQGCSSETIHHRVYQKEGAVVL